MHKNLLLFIIATIVLTCFLAVPAFAAKREASPERVEAVFAKQAPLAQEDIDKFIANAPAFYSQDINDASKAAGFSAIRGAYVFTKVRLGYIMLEQPDYGELQAVQGVIPRALIPTPAEVELIKRNKRALSKVLQ